MPSIGGTDAKNDMEAGKTVKRQKKVFTSTYVKSTFSHTLNQNDIQYFYMYLVEDN